MTGTATDYEGLKNALIEVMGEDELGPALVRKMGEIGSDEQFALVTLAQEHKVKMPTKVMDGAAQVKTVEQIQGLSVDGEDNVWVDTMGYVNDVQDTKGYPKAAPRDLMLPFTLRGKRGRVGCVIWKEEAIDNINGQLDDGLKAGKVYMFCGCKVDLDTWRNRPKLNIYKNTTVREATLEELTTFGANVVTAEPEVKEEVEVEAEAEEPEHTGATRPIKKEVEEEVKEPVEDKPKAKPKPKEKGKKAESVKESDQSFARCSGIIQAMGDRGIPKDNVANVGKAMGLEDPKELVAVVKTLLEDGKVKEKGGVYRWVEEE